MGVDEHAQPGGVALARLAQHPAYGLVHQLVPVADEEQGEAERVVEVALLYEGVCRHYGYAVVPQQGTGGQAVERVARLVLQVQAYDLRG